MPVGLFIILPYQSHYNACAEYAYFLRSKGWVTMATVTESMEVVAQQYGFETVRWSYLYERELLSFKQFSAYLIKSLLDDSFTKKRYKEFYFNYLKVSERIERIERIKPDKLFIDIHLGYYSVFWKIPCVMLHTKLSSRKHRNINPFTSSIVSRNTIYSNIFCDLLWIFCFVKQDSLLLIKKFMFLGIDETFFLKRIARINEYNWKKICDSKNLLYYDWYNIPRLILCPISFEYPWYKPNIIDNHVWIKYRSNNFQVEDGYDLIPNDAKLKIIYASVGKVPGNISIIESFFNKIIGIVLLNPDYYLIVSAGLLAKVLSDRFNNSRICIKFDINQKKILPFCDLFITHAGLNSVKEAIQSAVPMLAYPLNSNVDQPGNAARVVYHKLGMKGDIVKDSQDKIKSKIHILLSNSEFKNNCLKMKLKFEMENNISQFYFSEL